MIYRGLNSGFMARNYNCVLDEQEWGIAVGFGGPYQRSLGECWPPYLFGFSITWRKLANCVNWWAEYLGTERGRGVVIQYRVHSFRDFPISIKLYKETK